MRGVAVAAAANQLGSVGSQVSGGLHVEGAGAGWGCVRAESVVVECWAGEGEDGWETVAELGDLVSGGGAEVGVWRRGHGGSE